MLLMQQTFWQGQLQLLRLQRVPRCRCMHQHCPWTNEKKEGYNSEVSERCCTALSEEYKQRLLEGRCRVPCPQSSQQREDSRGDAPTGDAERLRHLHLGVLIVLAWWLSRTVYVPGGLEFEPQRLRGFFGFQGFK